MIPVHRRFFMMGGIATFGLGMARPAGAEQSIGTTIQLRGSGTLQRSDSLNALRPSLDLMEGDIVRTELGSYAELKLNTATRINLGPQSQIELDRFVADMGGQITIGGAMVFDRPDDLAPIDLKVRTAYAQIGVRGTRFFAGPTKGVFSVFVDRGSVSVAASGVSRRLAAGEGVEVTERGRPPGEVVKWGQARIREAFDSVWL